MAKRSRPIGLALSLVVLLGTIALALLESDAQRPPAADLRNGQSFIQDNLTSTEKHQYAVWVAPDGAPYLGRRSRSGGRWATTRLARLRGDPFAAPTARDSHNVFAVAAVRGEVHVAGNMHDDPLRYARRAVAGRWSTSPSPARDASVTYPAFTVLPNGTLLFWRREGSSGDGAVRLDALAPGAARWRSRGIVLDGRPSRESPYLHHVAVDGRSGAIHVMFEWRGTGAAASNNDVGYAKSPDGGRTWQTSRGARLRAPLTHQRSETVIDTVPRGSGLLNGGGLTVDAAGRPHGAVVLAPEGRGGKLVHVWSDGRRWQREDFDDLGVGGRPQLAGTRDGRIWLLGAKGTRLMAFDVTPARKRLAPVEIARVPARWEPSYDSVALRRFGTVEMLIPEGNRPHVVKASLTED